MSAPGDLRLPLRAAALRRSAGVLATAALAATLAATAPASAAPGPSWGAIEAPGLTLLVAAQGPAGRAIDAPDLHDHEHEGPAGTATAGDVLAPAAAAGAFTAPPNTDFVLDFAGSVDAGTRRVVTAAAGIWSAVLDVRVPIVVDVTMAPMAAGMLGAAGPVRGFYGHPSLPADDVLYPTALANQLARTDLDPGSADIALELSSSMAWDKAVDGRPTSGQSMLTVALHELGHGLGHTSWVRASGSGWVVNYQRDGRTLATPFDRLVSTGSGTPLTSLSATQLAAAVIAPLRWSGAGGRAANGGVHPRLYSPGVFELGSSIGHLDEATFRSELMTPFLARGEVQTSISPITRAMLADLGWPLHPPASGTQTTAPAPTASLAAQRAEAFVRAVATDFLARPATSAEVVRWRDHLLAGGGRQAVTRAFAYSDEWLGVLVDQLYRSTLGRPAEPGGRAFWIGTLRAGRTPAQVAAEFYASAEYLRRAGGTTSAWVRDLYEEILGRAADPAGLAFWVSRAAAVPRSAIAFDFYQSLESRRDRVDALFRSLLGRAPDAAGWAYWAGVLTSGRDVDLAVFLAASDEYWARAAQRAT